MDAQIGKSCPVAYYGARALRHSIKSKRGLARFVFRSPHPLSPAGVTPRCTAPRATERDVCGDWLLDERCVGHLRRSP